ncbi:MAG: hypothetical protein IJ656_01480 [Bacilli bacterium]|nr:hypothetical protein [Bacilli bacterium]
MERVIGKKIIIFSLILMCISCSKSNEYIKESSFASKYFSNEEKQMLLDAYYNNYLDGGNYSFSNEFLDEFKNERSYKIKQKDLMIYDYYGFFGDYEILTIGINKKDIFKEFITYSQNNYLLIYKNNDFTISRKDPGWFMRTFEEVGYFSLYINSYIEPIVYSRKTKEIYKISYAIRNNLFECEPITYTPLYTYEHYKDGSMIYFYTN